MITAPGRTGKCNQENLRFNISASRKKMPIWQKKNPSGGRDAILLSELKGQSKGQLKTLVRPLFLVIQVTDIIQSYKIPSCKAQLT